MRLQDLTAQDANQVADELLEDMLQQAMQDMLEPGNGHCSMRCYAQNCMLSSSSAVLVYCYPCCVVVRLQNCQACVHSSLL